MKFSKLKFPLALLHILLALVEFSTGESLFLTPLIKEGRIEEALKSSEVVDLTPHVRSYSGYITVNEKYNTNLFFWFFPAKSNWENAPVIFWSDGGPGATLLNSLLNMNGPYKFNDDKTKLVLRNSSWHNEYNVIYLDNPAGVGFSFTDSDSGYVDSGFGAAPDSYKFLLQFFKLFPNLKSNDFYNGGASYGGIYSTAIAHLIHQENQNPSEDSLKINIKGLILESPWINPVAQLDYGTILYGAGLIDKDDKKELDKKRESMVELIKNGKYADASQIWLGLIMTDIPKSTGYNSIHDITDAIAPMYYDYTWFVTKPKFRQALHAGSRPFSMYSLPVQKRMMGNFMYSVKPLLEELLNEGYKMLIYTGNFDIVTGHQGVIDTTYDLKWKGAEAFWKEKRQIWKYDEVSPIVSGYLTSNGGLKLAVVRNAAHGVGFFKPDLVLQLVNHFIKGDYLGQPLDYGEMENDYRKSKEDL